MAVTLCGVCAFLQLYCTQPLLPLFMRIFHASKTGAGLTVSAATLGVALSAPVFGALTERLPRKRVIVASLLGVSIPTLLAATSESLGQLILRRFLQGILMPGVVPGAFWALGKWPACAWSIVAMQGVALGIALLGWRTGHPALDRQTTESMNPETVKSNL